MTATLDPVWEAYKQAIETLKIVRRAITTPSVANHVPALVKGTTFDGLATNLVDPTIDALQEYLDDQAVLSLYASFESALRDHLIAQSIHLKQHATKPNGDFADALAKEYASWCGNGFRMDRAARLFEASVGTTLVGQVGHIRVYRHWVAHGKHGAKPPQTTPAFAYKALDGFLANI